jgi:hypothetical protein
MVVLYYYVLLLFLLSQVDGLLRSSVPVAISYRCQALAMDIRRFPHLMQEQQAALSALRICTPGFRLWFWQEVDEKPLTQIEYNVAQIIRYRQQRIIVACALFAVLLVLIYKKISIAFLYLRVTWILIRTRPFLLMATIAAPFYALYKDMLIFLRNFGLYCFLASPVFVPILLMLHRSDCCMAFFVVQVVVFSFYVHYGLYCMASVFLRKNANDILADFWENLFIARLEVQDFVNAVGPACIAHFAA